MTHLEQLIHEQVSKSVVSTVSRATDKIAEEMAQEILRDPKFRETMRELIDRAFAATFTQLNTETE